MVVDLAFNTKVLLVSGIVLGSLSIGILGYAIVRYTFPLCALFVLLFSFQLGFNLRLPFLSK